MSSTYGFDIRMEDAVAPSDADRIIRALDDHPICWSSDEVKTYVDLKGFVYVSAYTESKCPGDFDDVTEALADAVRAIWRACGRYVAIAADVYYVEETPSDAVILDESDYATWKEDQDRAPASA